MKPGPLAQIAACSLLLLGTHAFAAEPAYLDDRSSPEALVRSLYNAVNRKEYARAYSYFATPPAETPDAYAKGYETTENVDVLTGAASEEGAAGSIFYSLPVAIQAQEAGGEERVFAGCYTFRFVQPGVQTTPYTPLMIESGTLQPADAPLADALPESCGEGAPVPGDALLQRAQRLFDTVYDGVCAGDLGTEEEPESHMIRFNYDYDPPDAPQREVRLFRFLCDRAAYNETHVYLLAGENDEILPLRFAVPDLDIRYEDGDSEKRVEEMRIIGFVTEDQLVNSDFDPETLTLTTREKWRGVGDASSSGQWIFRLGAFSLVRYDVDASYDGEINPETVLDYATGP
ncbi:DUF1176 domain-containing protein [Chelativorans sp. AA-79]|uniref:DUF1176 domain-containing protein n=1 Tax=Chelativorans sp. AA-79 TaxID=3028735 RepID=UPI0023F9EEF2|nr:DUF1176 domain-containing protein [Chelativorans sp. AA-79]WEX11668.1 DUF1176 domain-containing protein [Chelativorans sp. AA-79]